ncbi:VRR-NUC domain-containing protein [Dehalobacter sp.]|uniref:VRR-NUC domain-containing protein n=1 Tax=Dehalobacter sp. TaxID=1962289 RepID=UPI0025861BF8|nr:VRR-NUC domain-containing protein [Dehalobacter sp.]MDJ0305373.1 VRR-NUC domain-containing protein [Dehalobacter sp.]
MKEHDIQNKIRLELGQKIPDSVLFRTNVGQAWIGSRIEDNRYLNGTVLIHDARPFFTGLPQGFSDLFGVLPGGRAVFLEIKGPKGKASQEQLNFLSQMLNLGAAAGVAKSIEDAIWIAQR